MKTLLLGTLVTTGVAFYSFRQISDAKIPPPMGRQMPVVNPPAPQTLAHPRVVHRKTIPHPAKLAKQKEKRKPYFLARASNV